MCMACYLCDVLLPDVVLDGVGVGDSLDEAAYLTHNQYVVLDTRKGFRLILSTPKHLHTLTPSHPHTLTPSHSHTLTLSHPHTLTPTRYLLRIDPNGVDPITVERVESRVTATSPIHQLGAPHYSTVQY